MAKHKLVSVPTEKIRSHPTHKIKKTDFGLIYELPYSHLSWPSRIYRRTPAQGQNRPHLYLRSSAQPADERRQTPHSWVRRRSHIQRSPPKRALKDQDSIHTTTFRIQQIFLQLVIKNTFNPSCTFSEKPGHSPALTCQVHRSSADLVREWPKDDVPHQKPGKE